MESRQPVVHVVADTIGPRLAYACHVCFERLLGIQVELHRRTGYVYQAVPKVFYTEEPPFEAEAANATSLVHRRPHGILAAVGTAPTAFDSDDELAAIFWLVTEYAAYDPAHPRDVHGRPLRSYLTGQEDPFVPVCHQLAAQLAQALGIQSGIEKVYLKHSFDIDNAFAYQAKGPVRWLGSLVKDLFASRWHEVSQRLRHALGRIGDPYDTHERILNTFKPEDLWVFFLMSDKGTFDRAISPQHPDFRRLVQVYKQAGAQIGLHPSYAGGQDEASFKRERALLEKFSEGVVETTRYHYLRLLTPQTQHLLLAEGIRQDYSPGPVQPGFWQGISVSIPWYDLEQDQPTDLMLHPAAWMDVHWINTPSEGLQHLQMLRDALAPYGGELVCIWHNDYFVRFADEPGFTETVS